MELIKDLNLEAIMDKVLEPYNANAQNISIYFEKLNDLSEERNLINAAIWNETAIYHPASLLKLFASVMAEEQMLNTESNLIQNTETNDEAIRAIEESIVVSDNDALGYLIDLVSDTVSGPELEGENFQEFKDKRNQITKFFNIKGYSEHLKIPNKCFSFDKYGRDKQLARFQENECCLTDIANVIKEIRVKKPQIYKFLKRDLKDESDYQTRFIGAGLKNHQIESFYSKAGWTSKVRHDAAIVNGEYLLVVMTKGLSEHKDIIPNISKEIFSSVLAGSDPKIKKQTK